MTDLAAVAARWSATEGERSSLLADSLLDQKIGVLGLGYVGLPLAVEFGKKRPVLGFDVAAARVQELRAGRDGALEVKTEDLKAAAYLEYSDKLEDLKSCGIFIVTVPTPVTRANRPDLTPLVEASEMVGRALGKGGLVIFESTVYPGCTRKVCAPILERASGLRFNEDFFIGYSPERINPADKNHRLCSIMKVTSGSTPEAADAVNALYASIIEAGTHRASSIEVAEAAKVIENTQRDLNIALMNELAIILNRLGVDTQEVLAAAGTKWNFMPFRPGLVGGHCIGVDPYYLTHCAEEAGYHPQVILAGRRINDSMGEYVAGRAIRLMLQRGLRVSGGRVLVMGLSFKEDCPDVRNSKVFDVIAGLKEHHAEVDVYDPWVSIIEAERDYGLRCLAGPPQSGRYDAVVVAVAHARFREMGAAAIRAFGRPGAVLYDVKGVFARHESDGRL